MDHFSMVFAIGVDLCEDAWCLCIVFDVLVCVLSGIVVMISLLRGVV